MATLSRPGTKRAEDAIKDVGGDVRDLFPTREREDELSAFMAALPAEYHEQVWSVAKHMANAAHRAMAAAAGALVMQQMFEPNSSYGMWAYAAPTGNIGRGANAVPGTIYSFASYMNGALRPNGGTVNFVRGQRFFGLMTGPIDSNNGWTFAGNTVQLATDAISGIETDTSFALFRPEIVQSRMIRGEYEGFAITAQTEIAFTASGYIPAGMAAAPSVEGLSVAFWDSRCLNQELRWLDVDTMDYDGMVRELVERIDAGKITRRLLLDYVPERRRRRSR